jgi:hypothetical protein
MADYVIAAHVAFLLLWPVIDTAAHNHRLRAERRSDARYE